MCEVEVKERHEERMSYSIVAGTRGIVSGSSVIRLSEKSLHLKTTRDNMMRRKAGRGKSIREALKEKKRERCGGDRNRNKRETRETKRRTTR